MYGCTCVNMHVHVCICTHVACMCVHVCARIHARLLGERLFPLPRQLNLSYLSTRPQNQVKCWNHALEIGQRLYYVSHAYSPGWAGPVIFPAYSICLEGRWLFLKELPIEAFLTILHIFPLVTWILNYRWAVHMMSGLVHEKMIKKIKITHIITLTQRHAFWALLTTWAR